MSMSTHVVGIKPPEDRWRKMKAIHDACQAADLADPDVVVKYRELDRARVRPGME